MKKGIVCTLIACFIWGWIFVIPPLLKEFSAVEIALGRYFFYGIISLIWFLKKPIFYPKEIWKEAIRFTLISNIGYYVALVLALQYCDPAICALIAGLNPIAIAFYGNLKEKEFNFRTLILPSMLIFIGLIFLNAASLSSYAETVQDHLLGIFFAFVSLGTWCWFAVSNYRFLKKNPNISPNQWSTLMGVATLACVLVLGVTGLIIPTDHIDPENYLTWSPELRNYLLGTAFLGVICSWIGTYFWNLGAIRLPVSLAGQLVIFETIFGVIFICLTEARIPPLQELCGILIMMAAIVYAIYSLSKTVKIPLTETSQKKSIF